MSRCWWTLKPCWSRPNRRFLQCSRCSRAETRPCLTSEVSCFTKKKGLFVSIFAWGLLFFSLFLLIFFFFEHPQERGAAHFAVVWVIVSPTVQSWRPCRPNRSPTSDGKTTWLIVQWTSKVFFYCGGRSILALWLSHATCTSRSQRAAGAYFREILKCWANPRTFLGNCKCHRTKEVYFYCQLRTMDNCFKKKIRFASHLSFVCLAFCNILILTVNKTSGCETFFFPLGKGVCQNLWFRAEVRKAETVLVF